MYLLINNIILRTSLSITTNESGTGAGRRYDTSRENANLNLGFMGMSFRMRISTHKKIFVHDPVENVLTARSKGFTGIVLDDAAKVIRALRNLFGDPVQRGQDFLNRNAKRHVERTLRSF
jgi:hypothetical protein